MLFRKATKPPDDFFFACGLPLAVLFVFLFEAATLLDTNGKVTRGGTTVGQTGGEITHATTTNELPGHTHTTIRSSLRATKGTNWGNDNITTLKDRAYGSSGGTTYKNNLTCSNPNTSSSSHNNVQKSLICKRWHRVG